LGNVIKKGKRIFMKKLYVLMAFFVFALNIPAYSAGGSTVDIINEKVQEKLDAIKKAGDKGGAFVEEIKIDKSKAKQQEQAAEPVNYEMGNLAAMNIVGGFFEGAIAGAGCGLIGYGQTKNMDINPLVNGAIIGAVSGAVLASVLSIAQVQTKKYYASDDYGINTAVWTLLGSAIGASGGALSYASTKQTEKITEGAGYGAAIGALSGIILSTVEFFMPENLRGKVYKGHALRQIPVSDGFAMAITAEY
jgi:ABC-type Fe3+-siderophore transport system permease subunit